MDNIELYIARENDKLLQHLKKWEKLIYIFDNIQWKVFNSDRFCVSEFQYKMFL